MEIRPPRKVIRLGVVPLVPIAYGLLTLILLSFYHCSLLLLIFMKCVHVINVHELRHSIMYLIHRFR